ncbi:MAG: geranylgeranyl reductase family protein [Dehalococcoidia bacterium]|nr:MAG: geranylgeranyl reductase family protein [Dehalococcoidia bacterium]
MDVNVIVMGAGPAGSTAAREIAAFGHRVLLIDRAEFPRDKACGGGVSIKTAALLPFDLGPVVEHVVTGVILGDPRGSTVTRETGAPMLYMTQRRRLDMFLVDRAIDAGVTFVDGQVVDRLSEETPGTYVVHATDHDGHEARHTAPIVIGADGANGVVGRVVDLAPSAAHGVALEGNLPCPDGIPSWLQGHIAIDVALIPGGYGWVFPKGDHINIGVGGWAHAGPQLREHLAGYAQAYGWSVDALKDVTGHQLPLQQRGAAVTRAGVALLVDAAGMVEPLLGEGMYGAVASACALAPVVHRRLAGNVPDLAEYQRAMERDLWPDLERAGQLADILHAWPGPLVWVARHSESAWWIVAALMSVGRAEPRHSWSASAADAIVPRVASLARSWLRLRAGRR